MNLKQLHEEYIAVARRPMQFGKLPIVAKNVELPIIPTERWVRSGDPKVLTKTFKFRRHNDRDAFVMFCFKYEAEVGHHARLIIEADSVKVELKTHGVDQVTELDKEYATFCEHTFKDLCYNVEQTVTKVNTI